MKISEITISKDICKGTIRANRSNSSEDNWAKKLLEQFKDIFQDSLGCSKGAKTIIIINPDVRIRKFWPARQVPLIAREKVLLEIELLEASEL